MSDNKNILALYDCRSKQEYIYRTNRVKEITGASELLAEVFGNFFYSSDNGFKIRTDWETYRPSGDYLSEFNGSDLDGEIVYEGGGNLCVIYKDRETYKNVNKALSRRVLENTFAVSIIASATEVTNCFAEDRKRLYKENALQKNLGAYHTPVNALPFVLVDRLTYQPIVRKCDKEDKREYTTESLKKKLKFDSIKSDAEKNDTALNRITAYEFDDMTDKGEDSILAIIYIDGNNMGDKIKKATENKNDYTSGITALRNFSVQTNRDFVKKPIDAIVKCLSEKWENADAKSRRKFLFRKIISGGDEITIVCSARLVPDILDTYYSTLTAESDNSACAGVALFHSHAPFADVYEIAEASCEMGKRESHKNKKGANNNYIDFHYCHAGITNDLDTIRERQEEKYTARPYEFSTSWQEFISCGKMLSGVNRSDVKALGEAVIEGDTYYREVIRRIKSRRHLELDENNETMKKMVYDVSVVYDLWFAKEGESSEQD